MIILCLIGKDVRNTVIWLPVFFLFKTDFMKQNPSWETGSHSAWQGIPCPWWNREADHHVHISHHCTLSWDCWMQSTHTCHISILSKNCLSIFIHTHIRIHIHTSCIHTHTHTHIHTYIHTHTHTHTHIHTYIHPHTHTYTHIHKDTHTYTCTHTHTHTHIHLYYIPWIHKLVRWE
jgi:hypothetical protein